MAEFIKALCFSITRHGSMRWHENSHWSLQILGKNSSHSHLYTCVRRLSERVTFLTFLHTSEYLRAAGKGLLNSSGSSSLFCISLFAFGKKHLLRVVLLTTSKCSKKIIGVISLIFSGSPKLVQRRAYAKRFPIRIDQLTAYLYRLEIITGPFNCNSKLLRSNPKAFWKKWHGSAPPMTEHVQCIEATACLNERPPVSRAHRTQPNAKRQTRCMFTAASPLLFHSIGSLGPRPHTATKRGQYNQ